MSVIQELFENYDHIPHEFRRHLLMMRELDELAQRANQEKDHIKKEILKKHPGETQEKEEERIKRQYERMQQLYIRFDSLGEEKLKIVEKLFFMQENFIRKLDQQIVKTEEDKYVQEKCYQDMQNDDPSEPGNFNFQRPKNKQKAFNRGDVGMSTGGLSSRTGAILGKESGTTRGDFAFGSNGRTGSEINHASQNIIGSFDAMGFVGPGKKSKGGEPSFFGQSMSGVQSGKNIMEGANFIGNAISGDQKKRQRPTARKPIFDTGVSVVNNLNTSISGGHSLHTSKKAGGLGGLPPLGNAPTFPFSQDENMVEEEDNCAICQEKRPDSWIACDTCDKWFHYGCVGITIENAPGEDEKYHCPSCRNNMVGGPSAQSLAMKRGLSEMPPQNIFEE